MQDDMDSELFDRLDRFLLYRNISYSNRPQIVIGLNNGVELAFLKLWRFYRPTAPLSIVYLECQSNVIGNVMPLDWRKVPPKWNLNMVDYTTNEVSLYESTIIPMTPIRKLLLQSTLNRIKMSHVVLIFTRHVRVDARLSEIEQIAKTLKRPCFIYCLDVGKWKIRRGQHYAKREDAKFIPEEWRDKVISIFGMTCELSSFEVGQLDSRVKKILTNL